MIEGIVQSFDERRGDGTLRDDHGATFYFHCVEIADGTRTIEVGQRVRARRAAGHRGEDQAVGVTRVESGSSTR